MPITSHVSFMFEHFKVCPRADSLFLLLRSLIVMGVEEIQSPLVDLVALDDGMGPRQVADAQKACAIVEDMTSGSTRRLISSWGAAMSAGVDE